MKPPVPKHEARVRFTALAEGAPTYTLAEAEAEAERLTRETAEAIAHPTKIDVDAIYRKFNKRS